ncbi:MAG: VWA domain-containing protein [Terracidiphilus sp.]|nr:VWA domain-containing protein [Terracidiphilus sp.]
MTRKFIGLVLALAFGTAVLAAQQPAAPAAQQPVASPAAAQQQPAAKAPSQVSNQTPDQAQGQADYSTDINTPTIKIGVNEVNLIFTVTDKKGHYNPNLKLSDFALLDDQKGPAHVNSFHQQINLPLRVGIVIDTSSSIHQRFQFEQQAATEFLLQILKARSDRAFVMGFDVVPNVTANWSNNLDALQTGITRLKPGGGTALYDAVYTACRDKLLDASRGQEPVRKAIILLSDGEDDQSRVYLGEAIKECQRAETIIYAISTNWTPSRGQGDKVMEQMATETGGQSFFPPSVENISQSFTDIEQELRSQYALTYTPADFKYDGAFRPIYLYCNDRRYIVRTKKGYFAPRQ